MSLLAARLRYTIAAPALALGLAVPLAAQTPTPIPQVAYPVVQAVPQKSAGMRLNDALNRLARDPQDVEALAAAGKASLDLGDAQAAIGFYQRALTLQPGNAKIKAGLAGAYVLSEDPFTAIELFDEAEKVGPIDPERLSDRGLAFDLVGDNVTAQYYYRQSLAAAPSDETLRRLALSQAISRDRKGMDQTLAPLLQKQDKAAWRTRAFGLAIMGDTDEAEAIARQTMPPEMATGITAYLRYMPRLTAAQQAGAGNLGHFPRASEIGNDDPRLAAYSRPRVKVAAAPPPPVPAPTKGKVDDKGKGKPVAVKPAPKPAAVPPPEPQVGRETGPSPVQVAQATVPPKPVPSPPPPPPPPPAPVPPPPASAPAPSLTPVAPATSPDVKGFDLAKAPAPAPVSPPAPKRTSLDEAFADLAPPSREIEPQDGAVDVRKVKPVTPPKDPAAKGKDLAAKDAGAKGKDAKPATPSHPSRIWVQLATGRDKSALGFDWRKLAKDNPALFKGLRPNTTVWGQSNRLLAGPFGSAKEANAFLASLKKAGVGGSFVWTSPAGQVVDALGAAK